MNYETKTTLKPETIDALQELIQVNIDSRDGFHEAADNIDDLSVSSLFRELASQRNSNVSELRTLVSSNLEEPQDSGSAAASIHRTWMDLRAALGGGVSAMLSEAERGEDYIKSKYEETLKATAGSAVTDVLNRQYADVKAGHDRVRDLRDACQDKD